MLKNVITLDRSLFYITQQHIDTFLAINEELENYSSIINESESEYNQKNSLIIAFNLWLLFLPDKDHILKSADKILYYRPAYLIYDALTKDANFLSLKKWKDATPHLHYLAALILTANINKWSYNLLKEHDLTYLRKKYPITEYLDYVSGTDKEIQKFLLDQTHYIKVLIKEIKGPSFSKMVKQSCDEAITLYLGKNEG